MKARATGDWLKVQRLLDSASRRLPGAMHRAILQEAHDIRKDMLGDKGINNPRLAPLSPWTIATGRRGTKPLQDTGTLRLSIAVIKTGGGAFVGVRRTAKGKGKMAPINLAVIHENGATINVVVTERMRRFFIAVQLKNGWPVRPPKVGSTLVIKIPARKFITPVIDERGDPSVLIPNIVKRLHKELGIPEFKVK